MRGPEKMSKKPPQAGLLYTLRGLLTTIHIETIILGRHAKDDCVSFHLKKSTPSNISDAMLWRALLQSIFS